MDIGGRNQAQPHRLRRHIRQRTVHRKENRREKAGERQGFQEESGMTLSFLSHQKTATAVFPFTHGLRSYLLYPCRFRLFVTHLLLYGHDNRLYHIVTHPAVARPFSAANLEVAGQTSRHTAF